MTAARNWHLERNDGTAWTQDDLDEFVRTSRRDRYVTTADHGRCLHVALDPYGTPYLLDDGGEWWRAPYDDCVVAWDGDPQDSGSAS